MSQPPESEPICLLMGTGDGCTSSYSYGVRGPIIPGSVVVRVLSDDVVLRLARLSDPGKNLASASDVTKDGVLHGNVYSGGQVNYETGQVYVNWQEAPANGSPVEIIYRRELHPMHGGSIKVRDKDGVKRWVTFTELQRILGLA